MGPAQIAAGLPSQGSFPRRDLPSTSIPELNELASSTAEGHTLIPSLGQLLHLDGMLTELVPIATTALASILLLVFLIRAAGALDLVDHPRGRKDHVAPVPVVGGIAMLLGVSAGVATTGAMTIETIGLLTSGAVMVIVGALDDRFDLNWRWRILGQIVAAAFLAVFAGVSLDNLGQFDADTRLSLGWAAIPVTVFAIVGLINAVNMADGVDGLAGMLVLISLLLMAIIYPGGTPDLHIVLAIAAVAVAAFLIFNLRLPGRARALTFMGNSGSAFLGLLLAWAAIRVTHQSEPTVTPALAPWLVALPIMDCLTLIARRLGEGRSPFAADRCHFHHLLLDRSWPVSSVVVVAAVVHVLLASIGLVLHSIGVPDLGLIAAFIVLTVVHYVVSGMIRVANNPEPVLAVASILPSDRPT